MKKFHIVLLFLFNISIYQTYSQTNNPPKPITVKIRLMFDAGLMSNMKNNLEIFFTGINNSFQNKTLPDFTKNVLTEQAKHSVSKIWEHCHFYILDKNLIVDALKNSDGTYEVRNILIKFKSEDAKQNSKEIVVKFNLTGTIDDILIANSYTSYKMLMAEATDSIDASMRKRILDFLDEFRTAYNSKDIDLINSVFHDKALIIVGRVVTELTHNSDNLYQPSVPLKKIELIKSNKIQYIEKLKQVFKKNQYIDIKFKDIKIEKHVGIPVYGVSLFQEWKSSAYNDKGWLFLIIDFKNLLKPIIWVRTWQPEISSNDEIFNLDNFLIE